MNSQKEIPKGFESWLQFYDQVSNKIGNSPEDFILTFVDREGNRFRTSIGSLKAKCFDEIIAKRIPKQIGKQICAEILVTYRNVHFNPEYYKKIEEMITAMSLPE